MKKNLFVSSIYISNQLTSFSPSSPLPSPPLPSLSFSPYLIGSRVYINNLKWDTTSEELSAHMALGGNLVSVNLYHYRDGRPKGCGIVEYASPQEAAYAISTLNDQELKGRKIQVREVSSKRYFFFYLVFALILLISIHVYLLTSYTTISHPLFFQLKMIGSRRTRGTC